MARRTTLLALLAGWLAVAAYRPLPYLVAARSDDFDSFDPFDDWDDYRDESRELPHTTTTQRPRPRPAPRPRPDKLKTMIRPAVPKVNTTVKNGKIHHRQNIVKTTNIHIESYTNVVVTKKPRTSAVTVRTTAVKRRARPTDAPPGASEPRPAPAGAAGTGGARRPSTRAPARRPTATPKAPKVKTTTCPPKKNGWLTSFFQDNKIKRVTESKPSKPGLFSSVYKWVWGSAGDSSSWFGGFFEESEPKVTTTSTTTTTTTTPSPAPVDWFYSLLDSEEDDGAYVTNNVKKTSKKSPKKNYKGYQLLRAYPDVQWKVHALLDLQEEAQGSGVAWWSAPTLSGPTDLLVPPDLLPDVKDHLKSHKIDFDVIIWDLQKAIMYENPKLSKKQRLELEQLRGHPMTWRRYHRYSDMLRYLEYLQHSHGDLVELMPLGRSSEGLPLVAVKVSVPSNDSEVNEPTHKSGGNKKWRLRSRMKPAVWIEGGAHAQEWIAPAVTTWILHSLVEGEKGLGADREMLKQADFYVMPVVNPDGYEYAHAHDRLWSKTRSRPSESDEQFFTAWLPWNWGQSECVGVDPDRNWDYHWGEADSSRDPCSERYAGPHPFSEPETRAISSFLNEHRDRVKVYVSLHAYSQMWLMPSSHAHAPFADDGVLMEMGKLATAALADLYGTKYQVGSAAELKQPASGMSHDWAKARAGVKYAYHVDLRDANGPYGYLLPGSQIVSTARETWQAIRAIVDNLTPGM